MPDFLQEFVRRRDPHFPLPAESVAAASFTLARRYLRDARWIADAERRAWAAYATFRPWAAPQERNREALAEGLAWTRAAAARAGFASPELYTGDDLDEIAGMIRGRVYLARRAWRKARAILRTAGLSTAGGPIF